MNKMTYIYILKNSKHNETALPNSTNTHKETQLLSTYQCLQIACTYYVCDTPLCVTLPTEVRLVKAVVFPVVMYGCESWTMKKAEHRRMDAFELWSWRRLLRVPWVARRSNQSILKEISPGCSLEGLMLKLRLQYFDHLMGRADSLERTLRLGKIEGKEEKGMTEDEMVGWHH